MDTTTCCHDTPFHCGCRPSVNKSFFGNNDARYHHAWRFLHTENYYRIGTEPILNDTSDDKISRRSCSCFRYHSRCVWTNPPKLKHHLRIRSMPQFLEKKFGGHQSFLWGHWYSYFVLMVTSTLGFKVRLDPLLTCFLACVQRIPQIHLWRDTCWPLDFAKNLFRKLTLLANLNAISENLLHCVRNSVTTWGNVINSPSWLRFLPYTWLIC